MLYAMSPRGQRGRRTAKILQSAPFLVIIRALQLRFRQAVFLILRHCRRLSKTHRAMARVIASGWRCSLNTLELDWATWAVALEPHAEDHTTCTPTRLAHLPRRPPRGGRVLSSWCHSRGRWAREGVRVCVAFHDLRARSEHPVHTHAQFCTGR